MTAARKALFLDRDGVINVEKNYVYRVEDFEFVPGIFELCAQAQALDYRLVVITNQAGIARGYYSEADYQCLTDWMLDQFRARGINIDRVYHCPYHPTAGVGDYRRDSFHRKPNPGMILDARDALGLDLSRSVLVGDKASDIEAGIAAGIRHNLLLVADEQHDPARLMFASLGAIGAWLRIGGAQPAIEPVSPRCEPSQESGK